MSEKDLEKEALQIMRDLMDSLGISPSYDESDPEAAFKHNLNLAEEYNNPEAQYLVFEAYSEGKGVEKDEEKAVIWLRKAADNGHSVAATLMGYEAIFDENVQEAVKYWEMAVQGRELNNITVNAATELARVYLREADNNPEKQTRALELLNRAASYGYATAQYMLGVCYLSEDEGKAAEWFEKASEQGDLQSKKILADMYIAGAGVPADYEKAETLYHEVIASHDPKFYEDALFTLASMYNTKTKDYNKAFPIWKELAEMGNADAQSVLGALYYQGHGTAKDDEQALYWWKQAAEQGHENARKTLEMLQNMENGNGKVSQNSSNTASSGKSGGCYIATAVYGSYDCPEVWTLRRFRDYGLAASFCGRLFIRAYYAVSPYAVKLFGQKIWFQRFWKKRLDRWVEALRSQGYEDSPYED